MKAFTHSKISSELYALLRKESPFDAAPEAICAVDYVLREIDRLSHLNQRQAGWAFMDRKWLFNHLGKGYGDCMATLDRLGLVEVNRHFIVGLYPRSYRLTLAGLQVVNDSYKEYLKALTGDKALKRSIQQSISKRGVMHHSYSDPVLQYIYHGLTTTHFDLDKLPAVMLDIATKRRAAGESEGAILNAENAAMLSITALIEKRFGPLRYNESDSRVWDNYISLSSHYRGLVSYESPNGYRLARIACVDIRACHPTFLSSHVLKCGESLALTAKERLTLLNEHRAWVEQFTGVEDPRRRIARETGVEYCKVKELLNKSINGYLGHDGKPILAWIQRNYPTLFAVWQQTDIKTTGPAISKLFESKLTLHPELYTYFDSLGDFKAGYEYDGFSLFLVPTDAALSAKVEGVVSKMQALSQRLFGFKVVMKAEYVSAPANTSRTEDATKSAPRLQAVLANEIETISIDANERTAKLTLKDGKTTFDLTRRKRLETSQLRP